MTIVDPLPVKSSPYEMTINLNVLNHLGIGLYSNVPAVLSEIVANAWDADADAVTIDIDKEKGEIVVYDTGVGMSEEDINERYLNVGYRKRDEMPGKTPGNREPMSRNCGGTITDDGYNISDDGSCNFNEGTSTSRNGTNPKLAKDLANNGGPTQTIKFLKGSPAINKIPEGTNTNGCGTEITTDQRGVKRPQGSRCDIAAYEKKKRR